MENSNENLISLDNLGRFLSNDKHSNESFISQSRNSNVDIGIQVDTTPIAYAVLCSQLARKQLSNQEFELAVGKLEELTNRNFHSVREDNDISKVKIYNRRRPRG